MLLVQTGIQKTRHPSLPELPTGTWELEMKRPLIVVAFLTLASAVLLAPMRSAPPMLLSDASKVEWKCSRSALILTTCSPSHAVRFDVMN
jgi:hypothetical protein